MGGIACHLDIGETIFGNIDFDREHLQENFLLMRERGEFLPLVEYMDTEILLTCFMDLSKLIHQFL